jgi:hypothetical protein
MWFMPEDEPGTSWRAATAAFSNAATAGSSSRRVRAARARWRAATAFSLASSASFTRASATSPGSVPMLAQKVKP